MEKQQFVEILFEMEVQKDDLEIIIPATSTAPGRVKLGQARIGPANPAAPRSAPLFSRTGAKIGFVATANLMEAPFTNCYWLEVPPAKEEKPGPAVEKLAA